MSNIFCFWSGGLDSTYMVNKLLSEGHTVITGFCHFHNNFKAMEREKIARENLTPFFIEKYPETFVDMGEILALNVNIHNDKIPLKQACVFLASYIALPNYSYRKIEKVALGYVMNDDAISWLDELRHIFDAFNKFSGDNMELIFPLIKEHKFTMYNALPDKLRSNITWCESSNDLNEFNNSCGICISCKRMINAGIILPTEISPITIPDEYSSVKSDEYVSQYQLDFPTQMRIDTDG